MVGQVLGVLTYLRYINDNSDLATETDSVCKRSSPHQEGPYINGVLNRIVRLLVRPLR